MAGLAGGIGATVLVQLLARGVSFSANLLIPRLVPPSHYGIGYVSFQFFISTALFFPKECFLRVALRDLPDQPAPASAQSALNLGWAGLLAGLLALAPLTVWWLAQPPATAGGWYWQAVLALAGSVVLEAAAQPCIISCLRRGEYGRRASGDGLAILVRTLSMLALVVGTGSLPLGFAVGQLAQGAVLLGWFVTLQRRAGQRWLPGRIDGDSQAQQMVLPGHWLLLGQFSSATVLKLVLTEGERFLIMALFSEPDWGVYGLVSNLGSLILRLLFAPVEEIAYAAFSGGKTDKAGHWPLLRALLLQATVGWLAVCFGPWFAPTVVRVLYGEQWAGSAAPGVLAAYCSLLLVLGLNGILEAFTNALAPTGWLWRMQLAQLASSVTLVLATYSLRSLGPVALVWANTAATCIRVAFCSWFVKEQLGLTADKLGALPVLRLMLLLAAAGGAVAPLTSRYLATVHAGPLDWRAIGGCVSAAVAAILAVGWLSRAVLRDVWRSISTSSSSGDAGKAAISEEPKLD